MTCDCRCHRARCTLCDCRQRPCGTWHLWCRFKRWARVQQTRNLP